MQGADWAVWPVRQAPERDIHAIPAANRACCHNGKAAGALREDGGCPGGASRAPPGYGTAGQPMAPPPVLVTTTTEGRTGMAASKSGQRVAGFSNVANPSSPGC